jgi:hypothetical protein
VQSYRLIQVSTTEGTCRGIFAIFPQIVCIICTDRENNSDGYKGYQAAIEHPVVGTKQWYEEVTP